MRALAVVCVRVFCCRYDAFAKYRVTVIVVVAYAVVVALCARGERAAGGSRVSCLRARRDCHRRGTGAPWKQRGKRAAEERKERTISSQLKLVARRRGAEQAGSARVCRSAMIVQRPRASVISTGKMMA